MARARHANPEANIDPGVISAYTAGMPLREIRAKFHIDPSTINRMVDAANLPRRTRSDGQRRRWADATPEQRAAHGAATGVRRHAGNLTGMQTRVRRAAARTLNVEPITGMGERELAAALRDRRLAVWPQMQAGPYSIDMAVGQVAVEVHRNHRHPLTKPHQQRRLEYLIGQGWKVLYLWCANRTPGEFCLTGTAVDLVEKQIRAAAKDPAATGPWFVKCDGRLLEPGEGRVPQRGRRYHR